MGRHLEFLHTASTQVPHWHGTSSGTPSHWLCKLAMAAAELVPSTTSVTRQISSTTTPPHHFIWAEECVEVCV